MGTVHNPTNKTFTAKGFEAVQLNYMQKLFNADAFKNSAPDTNGITNFLPGIGPGDTLEAHDDPDVNVLAFRDNGDTFDWSVAAKIQISPWRYNCSAPRHNPNGFDLWTELTTEETNLVIGNWKQVE